MSLDTLRTEVANATSINYHTEALSHIARFFKLEDIEEELQDIESRHFLAGSLSSELSMRRTEAAEQLKAEIPSNTWAYIWGG